MPPTYQTTRRVEFRDTDAAGIMHFSAFFPMMEEVEHEYWRSLGLSVITPEPVGALTWPRVAAHCDYRRPVRFEDVVDIELTVSRVGTKSVTFDFVFSHSGHSVAQGQMTAVCCRVAPGAPPQSMPIPDAIAAKLRGGAADQLPA